ncbi:3'(2'),5'-bisphosphate nucleotidase 2 [Porphyridium purpureum]|uniref:3'(2'),5'-bisphosphate nucleotidase 2 n=1 Tax=Porphyridium purpureum TaxID=35688 RepID=A0A5J4YTU3_PORPP|nr:3'(2'),5'-bisphosphate nucleotidase 2 [Porphyridium purpureum]|eukprot:POR1552..scf227_4
MGFVLTSVRSPCSTVQGTDAGALRRHAERAFPCVARRLRHVSLALPNLGESTERGKDAEDAADPAEKVKCSGLETELWTSLRVVQQASELCVRARDAWDRTASEDFSVQTKADRTPVTALDLAVQYIIAHTLTSAFPRYGFVAEETGLPERPLLDDAVRLANSVDKHITEQVVRELTAKYFITHHSVDGAPDRFFVLDPIDGTKGWISRKHYCVGLALIDHSAGGELLLSVLSNPTFKDPSRRVLAAIRGIGCFSCSLDWHNSSSDRQVLQQLRARADERTRPVSWTISHTLKDNSRTPMLFGFGLPPVFLCCGSLVKYFYCSLALVDVFVQLPGTESDAVSLRSWDHAAGVLCVLESGGQVTDLIGGQLRMPFGPSFSIHSLILATSRNSRPYHRDLLVRCAPRDEVSWRIMLEKSSEEP